MRGEPDNTQSACEWAETALKACFIKALLKENKCWNHITDGATPSVQHAPAEPVKAMVKTQMVHFIKMC